MRSLRFRKKSPFRSLRRGGLPYSKGGTSFSAANVRILCMKHNLRKHDKILTIPPFLLS